MNKKDFTHIWNDTIITNKSKCSNKLRGYILSWVRVSFYHDFDNILSKSLDLGLNLLQYRFDSENFFIEHGKRS